MTRPKTRWTLLALMMVVGVALAVASFVTPWFRSTLSIFEGRAADCFRFGGQKRSEVG